MLICSTDLEYLENVYTMKHLRDVFTGVPLESVICKTAITICDLLNISQLILFNYEYSLELFTLNSELNNDEHWGFEMVITPNVLHVNHLSQ